MSPPVNATANTRPLSAPAPENETVLPSGDHCALLDRTSVSRRSSVPSVSITKTLGIPSRFEMNAMCLPSGETTGSELLVT
jgi:hypothetical protein